LRWTSELIFACQRGSFEEFPIIDDLQCLSIETSLPAESIRLLWQNAQTPEPEKSDVVKVVNVVPLMPPPPPQHPPPGPGPILARAVLLGKHVTAIVNKRKINE
jgi:hypothetical protein